MTFRLNNMEHSLHEQYSKPIDQCLECWYGIKNSEEIDPEAQQEYIEAQIDQAREDGIHSHGRR